MLTDIKAKRAKCSPDKRQIKIADGHGLYLLVTDRGGKYWRMDYRYGGKRKTLAIGVYPEISLATARKRLAEGRAALDDGIDPALYRRKAPGSAFCTVFEEWIEHRRNSLTPKTIRTMRSSMETHVLPSFGQAPIDHITAPIVLTVLRNIEKRGKIHTAHRVKGYIGQIIRYAIATGRATHDPTPSLRGALIPDLATSRAALLEPVAVGELMRAINGYSGSPVVKHALDMLARVFVRPGELRQAAWGEVDLSATVWRVPADRMKMRGRGAHIVPLSRQVVEIINTVRDIYGEEGLIFPGTRPGRAMSDNTLNMALRAMGYDGKTHVAHGFRAMARSLLAENGWPIPAIERQLAHAEKDRIAQAYARAEYLDTRTRMMQAWSNYLDALREGDTTKASAVVRFSESPPLA
ncbi:MAG: integrase arm-type DNA-binding domain-containing protein [Mariprofundales bacterium]